MTRIQFLFKQSNRKIFNKPYYAILLSVGCGAAAAAVAAAATSHRDRAKPLFTTNSVALIFHFMADKFSSAVVHVSFYYSFSLSLSVSVYLNATLYLFRKLFDIH